MFAQNAWCTLTMHVKIYREVRSDADAVLLHDDLIRLAEWSSSWRLKLNASKCKSFTITLKRSPIISPYSIGGVTLDRVTTMRDLGVTLDQKLAFERHVDSIVAAGNRALGLLIRSLQAGARIRYDTGAITSAYFANVSTFGSREPQCCVGRSGENTYGSHRTNPS